MNKIVKKTLFVTFLLAFSIFLLTNPVSARCLDDDGCDTPHGDVENYKPGKNAKEPRDEKNWKCSTYICNAADGSFMIRGNGNIYTPQNSYNPNGEFSENGWKGTYNSSTGTYSWEELTGDPEMSQGYDNNDGLVSNCSLNTAPYWNTGAFYSTPVEDNRMFNPDKNALDITNEHYPKLSWASVTSWGKLCGTFNNSYKIYITYSDTASPDNPPSKPSTPVGTVSSTANPLMFDETGKVCDESYDYNQKGYFFWWVEADNGTLSTTKGPFAYHCGERIRCSIVQSGTYNSPALSTTSSSLYSGIQVYGSTNSSQAQYNLTATKNGKASGGIEMVMNRTTMDKACWYGFDHTNEAIPDNCPTDLLFDSLLQYNRNFSQRVVTTAVTKLTSNGVITDNHVIGIGPSSLKPNAFAPRLAVLTQELDLSALSGKTLNFSGSYMTVGGVNFLAKLVYKLTGGTTIHNLKSTNYMTSGTANGSWITSFSNFSSGNFVVPSSLSGTAMMQYIVVDLNQSNGDEYGGERVYLDNLSLKDSNNVEYLTNGDFENYDLLNANYYNISDPGKDGNKWLAFSETNDLTTVTTSTLQSILTTNGNIGDQNYLTCSAYLNENAKCSRNPFWKGAMWQDCGDTGLLAIEKTGVEMIKSDTVTATTVTGIAKTSERTQEESGSGWYNPMYVTLKVHRGIESGTLSAVYAAFYDKSKGALTVKTSGVASSNFTSTVGTLEGYLKNNPATGLMVKYVPNKTNPLLLGTFYYYDNNQGAYFELYTDESVAYNLQSGAKTLQTCKENSSNLYYIRVESEKNKTPYNDGYHQPVFTIGFCKSFGKKSLYTPVFAQYSNGVLTEETADMTVETE